MFYANPDTACSCLCDGVLVISFTLQRSFESVFGFLFLCLVISLECHSWDCSLSLVCGYLLDLYIAYIARLFVLFIFLSSFMTLDCWILVLLSQLALYKLWCIFSFFFYCTAVISHAEYMRSVIFVILSLLYLTSLSNI